MANKNYQYRFFLINDADRIQIKPLGTISINWELEEQTFYYNKVVGSFTIGGKHDNGATEYQWVKDIEATGDLCKELFVEVERRCDTDWELYARNKWTIQNCTFNNSKCNIIINPESAGLGSCLIDLRTATYNMLQLQEDKGGFKYDSICKISDEATDDILQFNNGHMFFYTGQPTADVMIVPKFTDSSGDPALSGTPHVPPTGQDLFAAGVIGEDEADFIQVNLLGEYQDGILSPPWLVYVAWQYRRAEFKIGGNNPPTPNGYSILDDSVDPVIYQKKPTDSDRSVTGVSTLAGPGGVPPGSWGACTDVGIFPSSSDTVYNGVHIGKDGIPAGGLCAYVTHKDTMQISTQTLGGMIQLFIDQCDPDKICISDFFQINPENPSTTNYVTGQDTLVDDIRFIQRSDTIFPLLQGATTGNMTFNELETVLRNAFQAYWTEDFDGNLRLEHVSFFENVIVGLDTTVGDKAIYVANETNYTYKRELLPFIEQVSDDGNHHDYDWLDREIRYVDPDGNKLPCVGTSVEDLSWGSFNSNLEYFLEYPTEIPRSGWVMVACRTYLGDDEIIFEDFHLNGTLSIKRLVERYFNNDRSALLAKIITELGEVDVTFDSTKRLRTEEGLGFPICCDDEFDPLKSIKTPNGIGRVTSAEHNLKTNKLTTNNEY